MTSLVGVAATTGTGSCHSYTLLSAVWTSVHGFSNIPDSWYALYYEYRVLLQRAYELTEPVRTVCSRGGGSVSEDADRAMVEFFDPAQNRLYAILKEARALK
jgi:hypothetical protein